MSIPPRPQTRKAPEANAAGVAQDAAGVSPDAAGVEPNAAGASPGSSTGTRRTGFRAGLGAAVTTIASAIHTRAEIAAIEFSEESARAKRRLVLILVIALSSGFALLALNILFVVVTWPSIGPYSLAVLAGFWLAVAGLAGWRMVELGRRDAPAFAATLAELQRDRDWLAERMGRRG